MAQLEIKTNGDLSTAAGVREFGESIEECAEIVAALDGDERLDYRQESDDRGENATIIWTISSREKQDADLIAFVEQIGDLAAYVTVLSEGDETEETMARFATLPVMDIF